MFDAYDQIRAIPDPQDRFVAACEFLRDADRHHLTELRVMREKEPGNIDIQEQQAILQFQIAMVSIERIKACRELVDKHGYSFVAVAALLTEPVLDNKGRPVLDDNGVPMTKPGMTRARAQHIYLGDRRARSSNSTKPKPL